MPSCGLLQTTSAPSPFGSTLATNLGCIVGAGRTLGYGWGAAAVKTRETGRGTGVSAGTGNAAWPYSEDQASRQQTGQSYSGWYSSSSRSIGERLLQRDEFFRGIACLLDHGGQRFTLQVFVVHGQGEVQVCPGA